MRENLYARDKLDLCCEWEIGLKADQIFCYFILLLFILLCLKTTVPLQLPRAPYLLHPTVAVNVGALTMFQQFQQFIDLTTEDPKIGFI